jgi:hypothetical protein
MNLKGGVEFARHGVIPFTRFSALLAKKNSSFGQKKSKTACSTPEKKTVEIGERRDRGRLFFCMIEMTAERKELDVATLCKLHSTLKRTQN